jgi:predicted SnoaL-like aldol condensation-catalyzing enzyme
MQVFSKNIFLVLSLALWASAPRVQAFIPLVDRTNGIIQQRPYCPGRPASPEFQRAALYEFISEFFFQPNGITSSFLNFIDENYIQHSANLPPHGRNNTLSALLKAGSDLTGVNTTIMQVMFDSPYGMVHYKLALPGQQPIAIMDLWRFEGTCMVEHWDVIESLPINATNPIALF